jgi:hypothetical protein
MELRKKMYNLFIDDQIDDYLDDIKDFVRNPKRIDPSRQYVEVKTVQDAIKHVEANGCPNFISFDHDLGIVNGREQTTLEFVDWLVNKDLDCNGHFIPESFTYQVHSANNQAVNRLGKLSDYLKKKKEGFFK